MKPPFGAVWRQENKESETNLQVGEVRFLVPPKYTIPYQTSNAIMDD